MRTLGKVTRRASSSSCPLATHDQSVVFSERRVGFFTPDGVGEFALRGVVFDEVGEVVGGNEVVERNHFDFLAEQACSATARKTRRPLRPKPLLPIFVMMFLVC